MNRFAKLLFENSNNSSNLDEIMSAAYNISRDMILVENLGLLWVSPSQKGIVEFGFTQDALDLETCSDLWYAAREYFLDQIEDWYRTECSFRMS